MAVSKTDVPMEHFYQLAILRHHKFVHQLIYIFRELLTMMLCLVRIAKGIVVFKYRMESGKAVSNPISYSAVSQTGF